MYLPLRLQTGALIVVNAGLVRYVQAYGDGTVRLHFSETDSLIVMGSQEAFYNMVEKAKG